MLQRSEWLPPFDDEGLRVMITEVDELSARLKHIVETTKDQNYANPVRVAITYFHQCLSRNHRYIDRYGIIVHIKQWFLSTIPNDITSFLFSYLQNRLVKIRNLRWETGPVIPDSIKQDTLSVREKEYFMLYNTLLTEYNADIRLDLTADLEVRLFGVSSPPLNTH